MRYESKKEQRKLDFMFCCVDLEHLIKQGCTTPHMFQRYSHAIGIIVMYQHYDPERVEKILAVVHESVAKGGHHDSTTQANRKLPIIS